MQAINRLPGELSRNILDSQTGAELESVADGADFYRICDQSNSTYTTKFVSKVYAVTW
jgi:hypothetical protein